MFRPRAVCIPGISRPSRHLVRDIEEPSREAFRDGVLQEGAVQRFPELAEATKGGAKVAETNREAGVGTGALQLGDGRNHLTS